MPRPKRTGKQATKGIPENLKPLAKEGHRVRFHGGWLDDSEQDRFIAEWIDRTPNAWGIIKFILHNSLAGQGISFNNPIPTEESEKDVSFKESESAFLAFDD